MICVDYIREYDRILSVISYKPKLVCTDEFEMAEDEIIEACRRSAASSSLKDVYEITGEALESSELVAEYFSYDIGLINPENKRLWNLRY